MNETSLTALFILLVGLIILSAFFSSSETGMMSLNRYRLKHMANTGHKGGPSERKACLTEPTS